MGASRKAAGQKVNGKKLAEIIYNYNTNYFHNYFDSGQEVMGPAYRTAAGMMLCMFFAVNI